MSDAPKVPNERAMQNGLVGGGAVLIFDGKGGMRRHEPGEGHPTVPPGGFKLVVGNSKGPEFKLWLKTELGDYNSSLVTAPTSRSRCSVMDDRALVVLRVVRPGAAPHDLGRQFLTIWIERSRVIIASELNILDFLGLAKVEQAEHAPITPADLISRLALRASDRLEPLIEMLGDRLDEIEESLITQRTDKAQDNLEQLRRTLINFRRLVWPQRDALSTLEVEDLSFFSDRDRLRLRESSMRTARIGDELQALSERAVLVHEEIIDDRAEQMNKAMLVLAAVTVIFSPLTLLTGLLGMNVSGIPFAESPGAFWVVCVFALAIGIGALWLMRRRHWL
ncbi:zinc transporter [Devosia lucknowensis]|uniref:Zinc transporter n=1 Tax=Devosia lucknowensis TaxID=1096929 RepID=A0A1Y6ERW6_9HYPH|nr:CorA family divalent cation transporter [Devosia lucknowensis]SMQ63700.1 zinc transporter [Devosia lucknowensis]